MLIPYARNESSINIVNSVVEDYVLQNVLSFTLSMVYLPFEILTSSVLSLFYSRMHHKIIKADIVREVVAVKK